MICVSASAGACQGRKTGHDVDLRLRDTQPIVAKATEVLQSPLGSLPPVSNSASWTALLTGVGEADVPL